MKAGQKYTDHNGRKLTILRVTSEIVEYIRQGAQVSRICPLEWFEAEGYKLDQPWTPETARMQRGGTVGS